MLPSLWARGTKKGRQLFQPVSDCCLSSRRGIGGLGAGDSAPCGCAAGGKGRNAGICPAIRADSAGKRAHLHFAEYVSELFCNGRKAQFRLCSHRGRGRYQYGAGCGTGGASGLERGGRSHCHLYQPDRRWCAAGVLFSEPKQHQPPAPEASPSSATITAPGTAARFTTCMV